MLPAAVLLLLGPTPARAEASDLPSAEEIEDAMPEGATLTGKEIWERYIENRMHSAVQHQRVISRDPGGNEQETRFWVRWKDFRDENHQAVEGVLGKTLVKFQEPFDMRHIGFLMIVHEDRDSDQWVYTPSSKRVRRIKLRGSTVMGTDYTFDDIAFQNVEDADYKRFPDEEINGEPVYVVEATLKPFVDSAYSRTRAYLEKEHYIPLRARYWDDSDVEVKEAESVASSIKEFNGTWVATNVTMKNLQQGTSSTIEVEKLDPNVEISENLFSLFRLGLRR
jgi:outer membrane lipoprotein-sorting protein